MAEQETIGPKPVLLNKAAFKALKREARRDLNNCLQERALFKDAPDVAAEYEQGLLACADVLGALHEARLKFDGGRAAVEFSGKALAWIRKGHVENQAHLASLDEGNEAGYSYNAKEAYLVHVLGLVVAAQDGGEV